MSEAERIEILALMERIEAKVDNVLEQLDGLLAVCERLEASSSAPRAFIDVSLDGGTVH